MQHLCTIYHSKRDFMIFHQKTVQCSRRVTQTGQHLVPTHWIIYWPTFVMDMSLKNVLAMASIPQMMHYLTLVHSKLAFWGSLGHFPAPKQPEEPLSGPLWIPITTQHVSGLVLNMIMSPKQSQLEEKCVWMCDSAVFAISTVPRCLCCVSASF